MITICKTIGDVPRRYALVQDAEEIADIMAEYAPQAVEKWDGLLALAENGQYIHIYGFVGTVARDEWNVNEVYRDEKFLTKDITP